MKQWLFFFINISFYMYGMEEATGKSETLSNYETAIYPSDVNTELKRAIKYRDIDSVFALSNHKLRHMHIMRSPHKTQKKAQNDFEDVLAAAEENVAAAEKKLRLHKDFGRSIYFYSSLFTGFLGVSKAFFDIWSLGADKDPNAVTYTFDITTDLSMFVFGFLNAYNAFEGGTAKAQYNEAKATKYLIIQAFKRDTYSDLPEEKH